MSRVFSNDIKVHSIYFYVDSYLYKRMSYKIKDKLSAIVTTDDNDEFISIRYLPMFNLPSLQDCIENKYTICFMLIADGLDMLGIPISINNNILLVQQKNKCHEYALDSILLRSELKSDCEKFLDDLQLDN